MLANDDDYFGLEALKAKAERRTGLVVGPTARQIFAPDGRIWDELLAEIETAYRKSGRPPIMFTMVDELTGEEIWVPPDRPGQPTEGNKWGAILGLGRDATVAEAEAFCAARAREARQWPGGRTAPTRAP